MAQKQIDDSRLKMVFFDAGGTLFDVAEPVGNTYATLAQRYDQKVDPELLQRNFLAVFKQRPPLAFDPKFSDEELTRAEYQWWFHLVSEVFNESVEFRDFDKFFAEAYAHYAQPQAWKLFDDVIPTLEKLREMRIKTGVISNFDSRLFGLLEAFGLRKYFDSVHISSRVGFAKPDPEIFQIALSDNNINASEAIHIGDHPIEDYSAAINAGLSGWLLKHNRLEFGLSSFLETLSAK